MIYDVLYNFISPVTGRVLSNQDYVLVGDIQGIATPSPILIDLQLDLINFKEHYETLIQADFVIGHKNSEIPKAQVLSSLNDGLMFNTSGTVSTIPYGNFAPSDAKYILQQPNASLTNAQSLSDLSPGGILKSNIFGVISIASSGKTPFFDDYVDPLSLQEEIIDAKAHATAEAAAAKAAAISYFTTQMLPYVPSIPLIGGIGAQITAAIATAAALAASAKDTADNAHTRIDDLTVNLVGDVIGTNNISNPIVTVFTPNPRFTGKEYIKIPVGNTIERPIIPEQGMIRYNTDI